MIRSEVLDFIVDVDASMERGITWMKKPWDFRPKVGGFDNLTFL